MASRVWPICSSYSRGRPKVWPRKSMDCFRESTAMAMCSMRLIFMERDPPVRGSARGRRRAARECGHHLGGEPLELLQHHRLGGAHGMAHRHAVEARVLLLELHERLDDLRGR